MPRFPLSIRNVAKGVQQCDRENKLSPLNIATKVKNESTTRPTRLLQIPIIRHG
jgi:hypothetical protein